MLRVWEPTSRRPLAAQVPAHCTRCIRHSDVSTVPGAGWSHYELRGRIAFPRIDFRVTKWFVERIVIKIGHAINVAS